MKLPDFMAARELNALRDKLGATISDFTGLPADALTSTELDKLSRGELEINLNDISIRYDGLLLYKNRAILLHIPERDKKFHVADCKTLKDMKSYGRYDRYIVSERKDGFFNIRTDSSGVGKLQLAKLDVCMNCLKEIKWKGRSDYSRSNSESVSTVSSFSITEFFEKYGGPKISQLPHFTGSSVPQNEYTSDWELVSRRIREKNDFTCQECGMKANTPWERSRLHVHHVNGWKGDNRASNLRCLCHKCHSQQPLHSHMAQSTTQSNRYSYSSSKKKSRKKRRY